MELPRPAAAATVVTFPILDFENRPRTGASSLDSEWIAWADTAGPTAAGNPGFQDMVGEAVEIATTGVYTLAVAAAELPVASPYVMIRVISGNAATQYLLITTASRYANVTAWNGTAVATPTTAGVPRVDMKLAETASIGTGDIAAAALNEIADAILDRILSVGTDSGGDNETARTVRQALRALRNKTSIAAGVLTVTKENDTTASWTSTITTTAGNPISASDPV